MHSQKIKRIWTLPLKSPKTGTFTISCRSLTISGSLILEIKDLFPDMSLTSKKAKLHGTWDSLTKLLKMDQPSDSMARRLSLEPLAPTLLNSWDKLTTSLMSMTTKTGLLISFSKNLPPEIWFSALKKTLITSFSEENSRMMMSQTVFSSDQVIWHGENLKWETATHSCKMKRLKPLPLKSLRMVTLTTSCASLTISGSLWKMTNLFPNTHSTRMRAKSLGTWDSSEFTVIHYKL